MKRLFYVIPVIAIAVSACSFLQQKAGDRVAEFFGNRIGTWAECDTNAGVIKWAKGICGSVALCSTQTETGPISGAFLKPLVDKFVPRGIDWVKPEVWGYCKLSKPKDGLKGFLYGVIDALPVKLK